MRFLCYHTQTLYVINDRSLGQTAFLLEFLRKMVSRAASCCCKVFTEKICDTPARPAFKTARVEDQQQSGTIVPVVVQWSYE